jgi:hypothetical protein
MMPVILLLMNECCIAALQWMIVWLPKLARCIAAVLFACHFKNIRQPFFSAFAQMSCIGFTDVLTGTLFKVCLYSA